MGSHVRVLTLLVGMLLTCCGLALLCGLLGNPHGMHTVAFMAAEVGGLELAPQVDLNCFSLIHRVFSPRLRRGMFLQCILRWRRHLKSLLGPIALVSLFYMDKHLRCSAYLPVFNVYIMVLSDDAPHYLTRLLFSYVSFQCMLVSVRTGHVIIR